MKSVKPFCMCEQTQLELDGLAGVQKMLGGKFAVEVIADDSGHFCGNGLTFKSIAEAGAYGIDLYSRWMLVREFRIIHKPDITIMSVQP